MLLIGEYKQAEFNNGIELINRGWYSQGWIYKNEDVFKNRPDDICYIPELSDAKYTKNDLLELCMGNTEITETLFYELDWQHPESELEDWEHNGEIALCKKCGKMFRAYRATECPYCHTGYKYNGLF